MKEYILNRQSLVFIIAIWWLAFVVLSVNQINSFQILNIIGFLFLIIVPGLLTMFILRLKVLEFWGYAALVISFSLLEIMVIGLIGNTLLPFVGVVHPLDRAVILWEVSAFVAILLSVNWLLVKEIKFSLSRFVVFNNARDCVLALFPSIFVVMSIIGAIRLNNGESGSVILTMLGGMAVYISVLIFYSKKVGANVIPVALFFVSLSLLFMTSLRGWYTTGHDVQREYRVFQLAKDNGVWSISAFRDAYDACLSITILPTVFSNTLKFFDPYVYKVFFQIIFAFVPGVIYVFIRRYTIPPIALLSVLFFVSFPTFFIDMPMLNRQEIAFLFFIVMFYIIYEDQISLLTRRIIFMCFGVGMILSHYSTTYTVIALLSFLVVLFPVVMRIGRYIIKRKYFRNSGYAIMHSEPEKKQRITILMVVMLTIASFFWSSILTDTSSGSIYRVITETMKVIQSNTKEDVRSGDVAASLFSWKKPDINKLLLDYQNKVVAPAQKAAPTGTYYDPSLYSKYQFTPVAEDLMPLTSFGKILSSLGINVVAFNDYLHQILAKLLQVLIVAGLVFLAFKKHFVTRLVDTEFLLLTTGSFLFLVALVVLPILSVEYGVLRALQQALIFFGIFIVIGSMSFVPFAKEKNQIIFAGFFALLFFASSTGIITQSLGGYPAQLFLNNSGVYYDTFYVSGREFAGINWLDDQRKKNKEEHQSEVQTDRFTSLKLQSLGGAHVLNDIFPPLVRRNAYTFLGTSNVHKKEASLFYNGTTILYKYPIDFLDDNKNLVYSNGTVKIYR